MDILQVWSAYQKDADPETIFPMYKECPLDAKSSGYGDVNLLHIASQNAHPEAVAWLLEQGLKPNDASGYGDLPLFLLAKKGFSCGYIPREGDIYRTALALLDAGGSVLRRDSSGMFCYHYAAQEGNEEFLRALAERGVKLNKTDRDGNTGLHLIAEACYNPLESLERVNREIEEKRNEESLLPKRRSPISMEELEQRKKRLRGSWKICSAARRSCWRPGWTRKRKTVCWRRPTRWRCAGARKRSRLCLTAAIPRLMIPWKGGKKSPRAA